MQGSNRRHIVLAVLLLGAIAFLAYSLVGVSSSGEGGEGLELSERDVAQAPEATQERKLEPVVAWDVEFDRYAPMQKRSPFSERGTEPPPQKPQKREPVPPPPPFEEPPKKPKPPRIDLSGWTYAGYITLDGEKIGLVQSEAGDSLKQLSVGDKFQGATVKEITGDEMRLANGRQSETLHRTRVYPLTPLDTAAAEQQRGARPRRPGT